MKPRMKLLTKLLAVFLQVTALSAHSGHHGMMYRKDAVSFLVQKRAVSATRCATDETYCEYNKKDCQNENEAVRELYCAKKPTYCPAGQTCYLSTPCFKHYTLGCSVNPCVSLPCSNNGNCIQNGTGFFCVCGPGYSGKLCEIVDPCLNVTCYHGGTCSKNGTRHFCTCIQGYDPATDCKKEVYVDPCDDKKTIELKTLDKRTSTSANIGLCDKNLENKWYKAYGYEMVTHDPGSSKCGSEYPVYLTAKILNDENIHNVTACMRNQKGVCEEKWPVMVKKCKADTIYFLSPTPLCNASYCFDAVDMTDKATTWIPSSMRVDFKMTWTYNPTYEYVPGIEFKCVFPFSTGKLFYKIRWYIDDIKVAESPIVLAKDIGNVVNTTLIEKYINTYGVMIRCGVIAAYSVKSPLGVETKSPEFYAGMKLHTPSISVERGKSGTIIMEPTIPYGCIKVLPNCKASVQMTNPYAKNKCEQSQVTLSKRCGLEIDGAYMNNTNWFEKELWRKNYTFTVKHREEHQGFVLRKTSYILQLKFEERSIHIHKTWENTKVENILVNVYKNDKWMNKRCYAVVDPHLRTFDGRSYEMQLEGTFVLYKHKNRNTSVQIKTTHCWNPGIFCVCGIVVQAGKDIYIVNTCPGTKPMMSFYSCGDGLLRTFSHGDNFYKIYMPTGTRIELQLRDHGDARYWDVYIYPTNIDVYQTMGLCGTLDDECNNDFTLRNGRFSSVKGAQNSCSISNGDWWHVDDFSNSWRVKKSEDLFPGPNFEKAYDALQPWPTSLQLCYCPYNTKENNTDTRGMIKEAYCSYREYADCEYDPGREKKCRHFRTRSLTFHKRDSLFKRLMSIEAKPLVFKKRSTISAEEASRICNATFNASVTFRKCHELDLIDQAIFQLCVLDIVATGDKSLAFSHRERGKSECSNDIKQNETLRNEISDVVADIEDNNCLNECSGHGLCVKGICLCEDGFASSDCSMNLTQGVTIYGNSENDVCDTSDGVCEEVEIFGDNFPEDIVPVSKISPFTQEIGKTKRTWFNPLRMIGEQQSRFSSIFNYPLNWTKPAPNSSSFVHGFQLFITVDGVTFSDGSTIYIHDSTCQVYVKNNGNVIFFLRENYCFIQGVCLQNGTVNHMKTCQYCNAAIAEFEWSSLPHSGCTEPSDRKGNHLQLWIIVVLAVILLCFTVGMILVIMKAVKLYFSRRTSVKDVFLSFNNQSEVSSKPRFNFVATQGKRCNDNMWCSHKFDIGKLTEREGQNTKNF